MAKEKKEGTEEEKVEVHDIDETFNAGDAPKDVTTETEEKVTTEEAPEKPAEEKPKEKVSEEAEADTPTEKSWKDFGLEDFEGKSNEEIARVIVQDRRESEHGRKVYGEQGEELGTLRKFKTDIEAEKTKPKEEPDLLDAMPEMTEGEILDFNAIYEKNPVKAMLKYGGATIKQMIASQLKESLAGKVEGAVGETIAEQKDSIAYSNFLSKHDDAQTFLPLMQTLDSEKHLGGQGRSYEELFELSKLGPHTQGVVVDPLYDPVYQIMAKHPTFSFKEALKFAKQSAGAEEKAAEKHKDVKKTIGKIDSVNTVPKGTPKSQGTKEIVTINDEFQI